MRPLYLPLFFVALLFSAQANSITDTAQLETIGIEEKLGAVVPSDIVLTDETGKKVKTGSLFDGEKPVLLNLVFYTCPHNCRFAMQYLSESVNSLADDLKSFKIGDDYKVLTVSFDETDTTKLAAEKAAENRDMLTRKEGAEDMMFFTADKENIKRLTDTVGFKFRKEGDSFDHQSALIALTPDGRVARYLYGIQHKPADVKLALIEAADGLIGETPVINKVLLFCYKFDPVGKKYALRAIAMVKVAGVVTLIVLTTFLYKMWRRKTGSEVD